MTDTCTRWQLPGGTTLVLAVTLTDALQEARRRHELSPLGTVVLGRAMVAASLVSGLVREAGRINLQVVGNGPVGSIVVDASGQGGVRGYLRVPNVPAPVATTSRARVGNAVGQDGFVNLILDTSGSELTRGSCRLVSGEVDEDVEAWLERIPRVHCTLGTDVVLTPDGQDVLLAAGVLVQAVPGSIVERVAEAQARLRDGGIYPLLQDVPASATVLAGRLFPQADLELLEARPLEWRCRCSQERVLAAVATLSTEQVAAMLAQDGRMEATCDFCRNRYALSAQDLTALIAEMEANKGGGPEVA